MVTQEYDKLSDELKEQIKLVYPDGYSQHLIQFTAKEGKKLKALRFETDDKVYLIRMTVIQAQDLVLNDDDFDEDGNLIEDVRDDYEDKYSDVNYLDENDNYEA